MLLTPEATAQNLRGWKRQLAFEADPSPEGHPVNQILDGLPNVFPAANERRPICGRCNVVIPAKTPCRDMKKNMVF